VNGEKDLSLRVVPPASGTLIFSLEQRGISVVGSIVKPNGEHTPPAASAIERIGRIALAEPVSANQPVVVQIASRDPRPMTGEVCATAQLTSNPALIRAEQSFQKAGQAVEARDWPLAFKDYLAAARIYETLQFDRHATAARHAMADLAYIRMYRERDSYALSALALARLQSADPALRGVLTTLHAKTLMDQPDLGSAAGPERTNAMFQQARELFQQAPFAQRELPRLDTLGGFVAYQSDDPRQASELWVKAANQCSALGDWQCYAEARQNQAAIAEEEKHYAVAMQMYEDALRALEQVPTPDLTADISDNLGRLQARIGLFGRSEQSRKTAMQIYARLGNCTGARRSVSSLGMLLMYVGSMGDASAYLNQAVSLSCPELFRAIANTPNSAQDAPERSAAETISRNDGGIPSTPVSAAAHCASRGSFDAQTEDDKFAVFDALVTLSDALLTQGDSDGAQRCIELARDYAVTSRAQVRLAYMDGMVFLRQQRPLQASAAFGDALRAADAAALPDTYVYRGYAHLGLGRAALQAGRLDVAGREARRALRSSTSRADIAQVVASLQLLAGTYQESKEPGAAIRTLRLAVRLINLVPIGELDGEKRATYLATQHAVFSELTELLIQNAQADEAAAWSAFEVSELGRARSLRYAANQAALDNPEPAGSVSEEYRSLLERVTAMAARGSEAEATNADLVEEIAALDLGTANSSEQVDEGAVVQNLNHLNSTLIEYAAGEHDMFAFVIDRGRIRVIRLGSVEAIARAVTKLNDRLRAPEPLPAYIRNAAEDLARLVLWPVSSYVSANRIVLVPDDALHTVPFAVLPWSEKSRDELVVHRAETTLLASALLLGKAPVNGRTLAGQFTLIGDPVFRSKDWKRECIDEPEGSLRTTSDTSRSAADWAESLRRLPGTRAEVLGIARLVRQARPDSQVRTLTRCDATASALKSAARAGGPLLHIATHGRIDSNRPRLSALALTADPAASTGAAFSLLDILNLQLHSRLVVLSACDTSRGRLLPGEGVLGLAQAFMQAGAPSVVASFWRVQDDATAAFMQKFYEHLISGRMTASAALRRAQLDQASVDGTYSWAAFSLYGSPDTSL
jgi:CHAT domain-containing protein